jgi:hypothetical protein
MKHILSLNFLISKIDNLKVNLLTHQLAGQKKKTGKFRIGFQDLLNLDISGTIGDTLFCCNSSGLIK